MVNLLIKLASLLAIGTVYSLTCYNGSKMLAMQSVGETTEECPASAYCYNMSTTAYVMLNMVKAGCSTWRCMLAKDTCIFTTFQAIPVSLCCCSYDRCNVGGNPVYSDNPQQLTNGGGGGGGAGGGGTWGNGNGGQNNNGWGNNNDWNSQTNYNGQNSQQSDWSKNYNYGGQNAAKEETMTRQTVGGANSANKPRLSDKEIEAMFQKKSIDDRGDEIQLEDDFKKVDKNYKTQAVPAVTRTLSARKEVDHIPLSAGKAGNLAKTTASPAKSSTGSGSGTGKEIQV
uniref:Uncharacterized protein n=2 Tax=Caenorhabditis japonica TaxID=281687 RepID=A0A8R1IA52_CAEJA